jgi:predicted NACHT family NTPase
MKKTQETKRKLNFINEKFKENRKENCFSFLFSLSPFSFSFFYLFDPFDFPCEKPNKTKKSKKKKRKRKKKRG